MNLELRFEYFNVFNHTQFNNIDQNSGMGTSDKSPLPTTLAPCSSEGNSTSVR